MTADCLPLLIASRDGRYVCSVHAGWQGAGQRYCRQQSGLFFASRGWHWPIWSSPWGPHIHPCCYEVSAGFYQQLLDQPGGDRVARHRQRLFHSRSGPVSDPLKAAARGCDNLWFDLRAFAEAIFAEAGVAPASVEWLGSCTYCTPQSLGSYRRRTHFPAPKSFQYSWIMREA
ncbi:laccase domain-containing protein [Klebsiella pneumoniae subsp. pneumoniae]|nr:laccase domain-containing protein [Klebsiella pneumoniae subsp. pneumoniae]